MRRTGYPYAVEVVADPYDVFAPGSVKHPLRPFFRWRSPRRLRTDCAGACAAAYVTREALQRRYPPAPGAFSTHYSSVDLPDSALIAEPRPVDSFPVDGERLPRLVFVGNLAQLYKAPDVLVDAVGICAQQGLNVELTMVGDGQYRPELETQAAALGLNGHVRFVGQVPAGDPVRAHLDQADLFCLPSHQEGLPRAMIEAMARGLPCLGSTVGGFPELLSEDEMVPPGDAVALAFRIRQMVSDPGRMARLSAHNLDKAREYSNSVLDGRRVALYRYLMNRTRERNKRVARA
jgi:glycosyltransferase involved in cell wall biosynthesis